MKNLIILSLSIIITACSFRQHECKLLSNKSMPQFPVNHVETVESIIERS